MLALSIHRVAHGFQHLFEPGCQLKVGEFFYKVVLTVTHFGPFAH